MSVDQKIGAALSEVIPDNFVSLHDAICELDLGEFGKHIPNVLACADDFVDDMLANAATKGISPVSDHVKLLSWVPGNEKWFERANEMGLLEEYLGDIYGTIQEAQFVKAHCDMVAHRTEICEWMMLRFFQASGIYSIRTDILKALYEHIKSNAPDSVPGDDMLEELQDEIYEELMDQMLGVKIASQAADCFATKVNPCCLGLEAMRRVVDKGYTDAFVSDWHDLLER